MMTTRTELTAEQQAVADRIFEQVHGAFVAEARNLAEFMACKRDGEIFGETEFEVRDRVHDLGAKVLEVTLREHVKKGRLFWC